MVEPDSAAQVMLRLPGCPRRYSPKLTKNLSRGASDRLELAIRADDDVGLLTLELIDRPDASRLGPSASSLSSTRAQSVPDRFRRCGSGHRGRWTRCGRGERKPSARFRTGASGGASRAEYRDPAGLPADRKRALQDRPHHVRTQRPDRGSGSGRRRSPRRRRASASRPKPRTVSKHTRLRLPDLPRRARPLGTCWARSTTKRP